MMCFELKLRVISQLTHSINTSVRVSGGTWESIMPKPKEISVDLRKRIVDAHKAGEGYTKLSQRFQVSRTGVRSIIKKLKESHTVQTGRGRKRKFSKTLERKLVRDVSKDPRTTAKTLVNDLTKSGIVVSKKTITRALHRNGLRGCRTRKTPLLQKRHLKARLKYAKDKLEKDYAYWKHVLWSNETKLELFAHRDVAYVWRKKGEAYNPKNTVPTVKHGGGSIMWGTLEICQRRMCWDSSTNDCRLFSSKKDTQLNINIRGANNFDPLWDNFISVWKVQ